ncbi:MAG: acyltransferase family protein [Maricaulaceae bacterium]
MQYRSEIDGLRAIAVLPVIFFHAGFETFSGGFVGVDIFFVISGYLITTILIKDLDAEKFSLRKFYERRARRILPALFFVILCCLPFSLVWMNPTQLKNFSQSLTAVSGFASNILFFVESGYFQEASELKPLLHTWSLAVEEQFYIFFPILLLVSWRFGFKFVFFIVLALSTLSLVLSHWGAIAYPNATFYLIHTRAWELGVGSLCGFLLYNRLPYKNSLLSLIGLCLIAGSIFFYDVNTPFPSFYALIPVGGTALLILFAQSATSVAKILSMRPLVLIGLISYSAYLWHQPLFAFARLQNLSTPSLVTIWILIIMSFALAAFSWRYVEQPFRRREKTLFASQNRLFAASVAGLVFFSLLGLFGHVTNGAPFRKTSSGMTWEELNLKDRLAPNPGLNISCDPKKDFPSRISNPNCRTGEDPKAVLWGDSYAMHLAGSLQKSSFSENASFIQLAKSQCSPILNRGVNHKATTAQECIKFNDQVIAYLKEAGHVEMVIMSSTYGMSGKQPTFDRLGERKGVVNSDYDYTQMIETAEMILAMGKTPVFVTPPPNNGTELGHCLGNALARQLPLSACDYSREHITENGKTTFAIFDKLKNKYTVVDLRDIFCSDGTCIASYEDVFLYRDNGHISVEGSNFIGINMDPFSELR